MFGFISVFTPLEYDDDDDAADCYYYDDDYYRCYVHKLLSVHL